MTAIVETDAPNNAGANRCKQLPFGVKIMLPQASSIAFAAANTALPFSLILTYRSLCALQMHLPL